MKNSYVLLAISSGGVVVKREYLVDVDEVEFDARFRQFKGANHPSFVTFFTRQELEAHLDEIIRHRKILD